MCVPTLHCFWRALHRLQRPDADFDSNNQEASIDLWIDTRSRGFHVDLRQFCRLDPASLKHVLVNGES